MITFSLNEWIVWKHQNKIWDHIKDKKGSIRENGPHINVNLIRKVKWLMHFATDINGLNHWLSFTYWNSSWWLKESQKSCSIPATSLNAHETIYIIIATFNLASTSWHVGSESELIKMFQEIKINQIEKATFLEKKNNLQNSLEKTLMFLWDI